MENQISTKKATPKIAPENDAEERKITKRYLVSGALWTLGGFVLLVITIIRNSGTKGHVVVWAVFLFGVFQFLRGMSRLKKN